MQFLLSVPIYQLGCYSIRHIPESTNSPSPAKFSIHSLRDLALQFSTSRHPSFNPSSIHFLYSLSSPPHIPSRLSCFGRGVVVRSNQRQQQQQSRKLWHFSGGRGAHAVSHSLHGMAPRGETLLCFPRPPLLMQCAIPIHPPQPPPLRSLASCYTPQR